MITTEREALFVRIERMYQEMAHRFKELNEGEYGQLRYNVNTSLFHECRESLAYEFQNFERNEMSRTLEAVKDSDRTSMEEIRDLDQLMVETLSYVGVQPFIPSVEELMNPRGHLIENVSVSQKIPSNDEEKDHWLLTDDGFLEFHGGGWLKNKDGFILDPFGKKIGSDYIESGLDNMVISL